MGVVEDFNRIALEDGDNGTTETGKSGISEKQQDQGCQK